MPEDLKCSFRLGGVKIPDAAGKHIWDLRHENEKLLAALKHIADTAASPDIRDYAEQFLPPET